MEALIIAGGTGLISSIVTITALKMDVKWIKKILGAHSKRLSKLEEKHARLV